MYACLCTDSHIRIPFDKFTMGVLRTLNVTLTQLHPKSWAPLKAFCLLVEMFCLNLAPHVFFITIEVTLQIRLSGHR